MAVMLAATVLGGCASGTGGPASASKASTETCYVCKYDNDLACIDVEVDAKTARREYQGKTYYFCSEECAKEFAANPGKYLAMKK
jgi:YHS domain-containing protein